MRAPDSHRSERWAAAALETKDGKIHDGGLIAMAVGGASRTSASNAGGARRKTHAKRPDQTLWAIGTPGPNWQPPSAEELEWRQVASSAVRAAAAVRMGGRSGVAQGRTALRQSAATRGRCGRQSSVPAMLAGQVQETPGVEAWDSVSQAPSAPGTPTGGQGLLDRWEVQSIETATASRIHVPPDQRLDYDISEHLSRNVAGGTIGTVVASSAEGPVFADRLPFLPQ
eukprot:CAMPEP_0115273680 /NCGR_PEP_ID=MMETSP0270-20121206/55266_1 /TAXON_ID=71861 /ORGANISM="Scrippsiella trochoidea, Strain CCMP3099" /LENGTH=226 /DNA_ID=CAMNT_0002690131 /DNA_START=180 /DNA_END=859 /DNA_ORIENTATION=+